MADNNEILCPNCNDTGWSQSTGEPCDYCGKVPAPAEAACEVAFEDVFGEEDETVICPVCDSPTKLDEDGDSVCSGCGWVSMESLDEYDDDHQPSEYDEWQDYMGGDDWDHGQFDDEGDCW